MAKKRGRPRTYPIDILEIGQQMTLPWLDYDLSKFRPVKADLIHAAIRQEQRRYDKWFSRERTFMGLKVTRIV